MSRLQEPVFEAFLEGLPEIDFGSWFQGSEEEVCGQQRTLVNLLFYTFPYKLWHCETRQILP